MSTERGEDEGGSRVRWLVGALGGLSGLLLVVWWPGCRSYPPVSSRESLSMMRLLYAACNTKDPARLAAVEQGVARAGAMPAAEREAFASILRTAKAGDWPAAERAALKFAQDQVGVGHPDAPPVKAKRGK